MSLRTAARFAFGIPFARLMPLNDDQTIPTPARVIGGAGPFDFSDAITPAAVTLKWKIDNAAEASDTVDLSGVGAIGAVTVDELVAAFNTAAPTGLTASKEAVTLRFKVVMTSPGSTVSLQVYGEVAQYSMIGQGKLAKFIKFDTAKSLQETPTVKAEETITTSDAQGRDTDLVTDGYRKGSALTLVDTARDPELRAIMEGGSYNATTKVYEAPTSASEKTYFFLEVYHPIFHEDSNKEADMVGYIKKLYRSCKGAVGQIQHQRGWADGNYTVTVTSYKDETGVLHGDVQETELTVAQYEALDLLNV